MNDPINEIMLGAATAMFTSSEAQDFNETYEQLNECEGHEYPEGIQPWGYFEQNSPDELSGMIYEEAEFLSKVVQDMLAQVQQELINKGVDLEGMELASLVDAAQATWKQLAE